MGKYFPSVIKLSCEIRQYMRCLFVRPDRLIWSFAVPSVYVLIIRKQENKWTKLEVISLIM